MASQFDQYLETNPTERELPPDRVLEKLYREADSQDSFSEFAEKVLRDPDQPMGRARTHTGQREPQLPPEEAEVAPPGNPPDPKRGMGERISEGWSQGFGSAPIGNPNVAKHGPWIYNADEAVGTAIRTLGGGVGALSGFVAGAAERLGMSRVSADRLQRDAKMGIESGLAVGGAAPAGPASQLPRGIGQAVKTTRTQTMLESVADTNSRIAQLTYDLNEAQKLGQADRVGAIEGEIDALRTYRNRLYAEPKGVLDEIQRKIVPHPKGPQSTIMRPIDYLYADYKDKMFVYNRIVKEATGRYSGAHASANARTWGARKAAKPIPDEWNPYINQQLLSGNAGRTDHFILYGSYDPLTLEINGKSLAAVSEIAGDHLPEAMRYAVAKRAVELEGRGIVSGFDADFVKSVVTSTEELAKTDPRYQKYQNFATELTKYTRTQVNYLVKSGIYSEAEAEAFVSQNLYYLPYYRLMDPTTRNAGAPRSGTKNPIKAIQGSDRDILEPFESIIRNTKTFIDIAEQNRALFWLTRMAEIYELPHVAQRVTVRSSAEQASESLMQQRLGVFRQENSAAPSTMGGADPLRVFEPEFWKPSANEITVMVKGEREVWRVDPAIAEAMKYVDPSTSSFMFQLMALPARTLRAGATKSPDFPIANTLRDQPPAMMNTRYGYTPLDIWRSLADLAQGSPGFKEKMRAGGANAYMTSIDQIRLEMARNKIIPKEMQTAGERFKTAAMKPIDVLTAISNFSEEMTRLSGYLNARAKGASPLSAAFEARELTLDFMRMGMKTRGLSMLVAFHNAQAEGVDKFFRAGVANPGRMGTVAMATQVIPAIYLWAAQHDDPRYKNTPMFERNSNFIILTDKWTAVDPKQAEYGWRPLSVDAAALKDKEALLAKYPQLQGRALRLKDGKWQLNDGPLGVIADSYKIRQKEDGTWEANRGEVLKYPKSWEAGVTFASVLERMLDKYVDQDPEGARNLWGSVMQAYSPNVMPNISVPVIEHITGKSLFFPWPLETEEMRKRQPVYRYNEYTTETAKFLGQFLNRIPGMKNNSITSPMVLENYVRGWSAQLGIYGLQIIDEVLRAGGIAKPYQGPTPAWADYPLIKRFVSQNPRSTAEPIGVFYDRYIEMKQAQESVKFLDRRGNKEEARAVESEQLFARIEGYAEEINFYRKAVTDLFRIPTRPAGPQAPRDGDPKLSLTAEEKRDLINTSYMRMVSAAKEGMRELLEGTNQVPGPKKDPPAHRTNPDPRVRRFGDVRSNATQQSILRKMTKEEQDFYSGHAHKETREMYQRPSGPPPYDIKGIMGDTPKPPQPKPGSRKTFQQMLDDARRSDGQK